MFTWASILSGLVKLANRIGEWLKIRKAERTGEERQELRNRREHDDRVERGLAARRRALREFDERVPDDETDGGS